MQDELEKRLTEIRNLINSGNHESARKQLTAAIAEYQDDPKASIQLWWLSSHAVLTNAERIASLRRILKIYPNHERVRRRLLLLLRDEAAAALAVGDGSRGKFLLEEVVTLDDQNEHDWQRLLTLADSDKERLEYLDHILSLNPQNEAAFQQLEHLRREALESHIRDETASQKLQEVEDKAIPSLAVADTSDQASQEEALLPAGQLASGGLPGAERVITDSAALADAASDEAEPPSEESDDIALMEEPEPFDPVFSPLADMPHKRAATESEQQQVEVEAADRQRIAPMQWQHLFQSEVEVCNRFIEEVDALLGDAESWKDELLTAFGQLEQSKERRQHWTARESISTFLAPAVMASVNLVGEMLLKGKLQAAFRGANVFGEFCKTLIAYNSEEFTPVFADLLAVAACSVGKAELEEDEAVRLGELALAEIQRPLESKCVRPALATFFSRREDQFKGARFDELLAEQVLHAAYAWCFEDLLESLIAHHLPETERFVRQNLPFVWQLELGADGRQRRKKWQRTLVAAGYQALLDELSRAGQLINPADLGTLDQELLQKIIEAEATNHYDRIEHLFAASAGELRDYLEHTLPRTLVPREPELPALSQSWQNDKLRTVQRLARQENQQLRQQALAVIREFWADEVDNRALQIWVAYLQLQCGELLQAEQMWHELRDYPRSQQEQFLIDWNLAVIGYRCAQPQAAYQVLLPYLETICDDESLIPALLSLALSAGDHRQFVNLVPFTLTGHYLPLAITLAGELNDRTLQRRLLAKWLRMMEWQLPPVTKKFSDFGRLQQEVNRAVMTGLTEEAIIWLRRRIRRNPNYLGDYAELARLLERKQSGIDEAFHVLSDRLRLISKSRHHRQNRTNDAGRDLLYLCKKHERSDLGRQAFKLCVKARVSEAVLQPFSKFAPPSAVAEKTADAPALAKRASVEANVRHGAKRQSADERRVEATGKIGVFVDHENLLKSLVEISTKRAREVPTGHAKVEWFAGALRQLLETVKKRIGPPDYRIAVAFWSRAVETQLMSPYFGHQFVLQQPESVKRSNAVDFKLADEVRRAQRQAQATGEHLSQVVIVSGDGDFVHMVRSLVHDGVRVQVWSSSQAMNQQYVEVVGEENVVILDDVLKW